MPQNPRAGRPYMRALAALKARGPIQECWRQRHPECARVLYADAPKGHPNAITLGHIISADARPDLFWDPGNHAPECGKCNYSDGAAITNRKRRAKRRGDQVDASSLQPRRKKYRNPRWSGA
jgi:hypothetical protein